MFCECITCDRLVQGPCLQSLSWHYQSSHLPVLPHTATVEGPGGALGFNWPKAEILPLFHMDQHNNAEFPLSYSFKSRVEKYKLQTGVRVAG